jgi:hypothetical protein
MSIKHSSSKKVNLTQKEGRKSVSKKDIDLFNNILSKKIEKETSDKPIVIPTREKVHAFVEKVIISSIKELREKTNKNISTYDVVVPNNEIDAVDMAAKSCNIVVSNYDEEGIIIFNSNSVTFK